MLATKECTHGGRRKATLVDRRGWAVIRPETTTTRVRTLPMQQLQDGEPQEGG